MNQQGITFSSLKSQLSKHDGLLENLTIRSAAEKKSTWFPLISSFSIDRWLVPPKPQKIVKACQVARTMSTHELPCQLFFLYDTEIENTQDLCSSVPRQFSFTYVRNNAQFLCFHLIFAIINLGLFARWTVIEKYLLWKDIKIKLKKSSQLWFFHQPSCRVPPLLEHRQLAQLVDHVSACRRLGVHY